MAKVKQTVSVVKCKCDLCGQVAHVVPGGSHFHCVGFSEAFFVAHPAMKGRLRGTKRGTWQKVREVTAAEVVAKTA